MAAAALVVAAIVVGAPADAAVTADAAPRDLRPVQECADLAAWLAHLGGDCGAAGLTRGSGFRLERIGPAGPEPKARCPCAPAGRPHGGMGRDP